MSAIDELKRLLDERGVEYKTHDIITGKAVTWTGSVCNWVALPDERGLAVGVYKDYLTPEQAIAATLGSGKLTAEQVRDLIKRHSMAVDYVGNVRRLDNSVFEEIADELNATLGGGECEQVKRGTKPDGTPRWRCSICDYGLGDDRWSYCPKCGARIRKAVKR